jgi:hypothetical protein
MDVPEVYDEPSKWRNGTVDLTPVVGQNIRVVFKLEAPHPMDVWIGLDNVAINTADSTPPYLQCTTDSIPVNTTTGECYAYPPSGILLLNLRCSLPWK